MVETDCNLGKALFVGILILGAIILFGFVFVHTHPGFSDFRGGLSSGHLITVSATGSATGIPSQAILYLAINGTGNTTQAANANLSATVNQLNQTISPYINGNLSSISTGYYSVQKIYCPYYPTTTIAPVGPQPLSGANNSTAYPACPTGYVATESLTVTIPNFGNASAAVDALSSIPNVYVGNVNAQFSTAQIAALRTQALKNALSNATLQAEAVVGNSALSTQNITIGNAYTFYPSVYNSASATSGSGSAIFAGTSSVTESISVQFSYR